LDPLAAVNFPEFYILIRLEGKVNYNGDIVISLLSSYELIHLKSLIWDDSSLSHENKIKITDSITDAIIKAD
jgi:hypothetical protein